MEEKEYSNVYAVPANYTDSGKLFGGMLEIRNTVEAGFIIILLAYPEVMWLPVGLTIKVVIMTVTLLPLAVVALMGIAGDSLLQFAGHMLRHSIHRRKLHFRRIGYHYDKEEIKRQKKTDRRRRKEKKPKKAKTKV